MNHEFEHPDTRAERRLRHRLPRAGFTIIELLVVVAIIIVLLGILIVAVQAATRTAARASTVTLMNSMKQGLERFKGDIGYLPPMLGPSNTQLRDLFPPPDQTLPFPTYRTAIQDWYSTAAMADYLLGWDVGINDGYGYPAQNETPPAGIRHPDTDGVWSGTVAPAPGPANGSLAARNPPLQGKVYGPYLELKDTSLLGAVNGVDGSGNQIIVFAGDIDPAVFATLPKVICDYWGRPIRYYRRPHPPGALGQSYRTNTDINRDNVIDGDDVVPTLSDVFMLRPWTIKAGSESINRFADADGRTASTAELDSGEFALFSAGADKSFSQGSTVDTNEFNKDNIVEVGP